MESPRDFATAFLKGGDGDAPAPKAGGSPGLLAAAKAVAKALGVEVKDPEALVTALKDFTALSDTDDGDEASEPAEDDGDAAEGDLTRFQK